MSSSAYQLSTLPCGLKVATEHLPHTDSIAIAFSVNVGARYETETENGLSHFLEHMAFKGTKTRSAREIAEQFDDVGAHLNAFTSTEHTVYYARCLPEDLAMAVDVLADILQNSTFAEDELERERGVILQEIAMHQDTPDDLVFDHFHETVFPGQPLGRSILGKVENIKRFSSDDLRSYMAKHYCPARMVVTAAGNVDHDALVKLLERVISYESAGELHDPVAGNYIGGERRVKEDFEQMHLVMGLPGLSYHDSDYYAAQIMGTALGGGMSSRLFQEVREKRGLAYSVYSFLSSHADTGMFGMYAAAAEASAAELAPVLCDEVMKLAEGGIDNAEFERAKRQHTAGIRMMHENVSSVAEWMGRHLLCYGEYRSVEDLTKRYDALSTADITRVLHRLLEAGPHTLAALGPQKGLPAYDTLASKLGARHAA